MHTWTLVHRDKKRFGELTCSENEVEVCEGDLGAAGSARRQTFTGAEELKEFVEDWLEEMTLDGYVELGEGERLPDQKTPPLPYEKLGRATLARPALADDEDDEDDGYDDYDADQEWEDEFAYPVEEDGEKPAASLRIDEALDEPKKEHPFDVDLAQPAPLEQVLYWEAVDSHLEDGLHILDQLD